MLFVTKLVHFTCHHKAYRGHAYATHVYGPIIITCKRHAEYYNLTFSLVVEHSMIVVLIIIVNHIATHKKRTNY